MLDYSKAADLIVEGSSDITNCTITQRTKEKAIKFIDLVRASVYPQVFDEEKLKFNDILCVVEGNLRRTAQLLEDICTDIYSNDADKASEVTERFMQSVPKIAEYLNKDIQAAYDGDPAAKSKTEIMLAYPAFEAISTFRIAHELLEAGVPLLPRILTEHAHKITGIDIHPGATIGHSFFIDHGTGVVIGETCVIGDNVKLYQGVTLGAKSFPKDASGNPVKGIKRHPNIGNNVVIYAGATILGGDTFIGDDSVIGGNVWLIHSVPAGSKIMNNQQ